MSLSKDWHFSCLAWLIHHLDLVLHLLMLRNLLGSCWVTHSHHCELHEHACTANLVCLSSRPLHEGWQTHSFAWCCLHRVRAGTAGMVSKLGRLKGSSPASCSCAAPNTQQMGLSYLTTYIPYSGAVIPSFSSAFRGGLWVLTLRVKRQSSSPALYCSELLCKDHRVTQNDRIS